MCLLQLTGTVTNGLANTIVKWTLTVYNVNDAPVFYGAPYDVTLDEFQTGSTETPVLRLSVADPDDGQGTPAFELKEVTATCRFFDIVIMNNIKSILRRQHHYERQNNIHI